MFEPTQNDALFVHIAPISDLCQSFAIYEIATLSYMIGMSKEINEHTTNSSLCIICSVYANRLLEDNSDLNTYL